MTIGIAVCREEDYDACERSSKMLTRYPQHGKTSSNKRTQRNNFGKNREILS